MFVEKIMLVDSHKQLIVRVNEKLGIKNLKELYNIFNLNSTK